MGEKHRIVLTVDGGKLFDSLYAARDPSFPEPFGALASIMMTGQAGFRDHIQFELAGIQIEKVEKVDG